LDEGKYKIIKIKRLEKMLKLLIIILKVLFHKQHLKSKSLNFIFRKYFDVPVFMNLLCDKMKAKNPIIR
jgi:hypothetical protein